ncbi:MAG: ABC transporter substrate-binding protein [Rhodovibrionaceae bacterium]|nr:ABC transporter substrate-binding protein [Rhodovibrionaceae bacterium]
MSARWRRLSRRCKAVVTGAVAATALAWPPFASAQKAPAPAELIEPPFLGHPVAAGELPAVSERLPDEPMVVSFPDPNDSPGLHGGVMRMIMGRQKDIRMMVVYGYARLIGYNEDLELVPDILHRVENENNQVFTLHMREGHKWSDGHPFTAEDFRYWWEDIANNEELSPVGPPTNMLVKGKPPQFEVIDETTVRYTWEDPNPLFLPALADTLPMFIYSPAHYLKQFHIDYADPEQLKAKVEEAGSRNWAGLHNRRDRPYRSDNPDFPVLQPWWNRTAPPSERFIFERNPYYHRVDVTGRQLPYIDQAAISIVDRRLVAAKTAAGESDLQARNIRLNDYTFLRAAEDRNNYQVLLWRTGKGSQVALYPNLNAADPVWRELLQDRRFRQALSLGIHRHEINQVIYYGLALEGANTVLPRSPLYKPEYRHAWSDFDVERANRLLDDIGLTERDDRGVRLLPDGRPAEIIVDTAGESTEESDVLELIHDSWLQLGIKLFTRPSQREVFRNRVFSGESIMSVWSGLINAIPTADMTPEELAPTSQVHLQWPQWGQYYETGREAGSAPTLDSAKRLVDLNLAWRRAKTNQEAREIWDEMLSIHADEVFTIGTVAGVPQPIVVDLDLRNVPKDAFYNWAPTAYFGVYKPDTFWFGEAERRAKGTP